MKKINILMLILFFIFSLSACDTTPSSTTINQIDIYYLNDLHGAILDDDNEMGLAYIGNYLNSKYSISPDSTVIIAGGDMLQGSALSNYYYGLSTIDIMNDMHFDAFILGNHEFDWGLDKVQQYFDGDPSNGEANFPLLSANTYYKGTTTIPDDIEPYTIIERGDLKIGIIGMMGYGLENSIATSRIDPYEFADSASILGDLSYDLRVNQGCDIVLLVAHDGGNINDDAAYLTGDKRIDAIFNAHSHQEYTDELNGIPIIQSGANGEYVGHVSLSIDNKQVTGYTSENLTKADSQYLRSADPTILALINSYKQETDAIFNTPIITSSAYVSTGELTHWLAHLMRIRTGVDIAIHNSGGTRSPINPDSVITLSTLYDIWPFDNIIKTVKLKGSDVINILQTFGTAQTDTDITNFDPDAYYTVATNDYVFDKSYNPFIYGEDIVNTGLLLRDIAQNELELQGQVYDSFSVDNDILTTPTPVYDN